jgi:hypothetical protein
MVLSILPREKARASISVGLKAPIYICRRGIPGLAQPTRLADLAGDSCYKSKFSSSLKRED